MRHRYPARHAFPYSHRSFPAQTPASPPPSAQTGECSDNRKFYRYDSLAEMLEWIDKTPRVTKSNSAYDGRPSFTHSDSWEHALELTEGWRDGAQQVALLSQPIVESISSLIERKDYFYDVEGVGIDVSRFIDGEPECWQNIEQTIVQGRGNRVLRLCASISTSGGVSCESMVERGVFICATVDCLERAGYACEVTISVATQSPSYTPQQVDILVKRADQPVDIARLAFAIAHPSMLRRFMFAMAERIPGWPDAEGSKGVPIESVIPCDLYFPRHYLGETFPPSRLIEILKAQGVTLRDEKETI